MFETAEFRIQFQHVNFQRTNNGDETGRYNTLCNIYEKLHGMPRSNLEPPLCSGLAILHPGDAPDKIIGKKVALEKALIHRIDLICPDAHICACHCEKIKHKVYHDTFTLKSKRTEIWNAFWKWIASWKLNCEVCGSKDIRDKICVDCAIKFWI